MAPDWKPTYWKSWWPAEWWEWWCTESKAVVWVLEGGGVPAIEGNDPYEFFLFRPLGNRCEKCESTALTNEDKARFLERFIPFHIRPTRPIEEVFDVGKVGGLVRRPWDIELEQPLLVLCAQCRSDRFARLKSRGLYDEMAQRSGCMQQFCLVSGTIILAYEILFACVE